MTSTNPRDLFDGFESAIQARLRHEQQLAEHGRQNDPELKQLQDDLRAAEESLTQNAAAAETALSARKHEIEAGFLQQQSTGKAEHDARVREIVRTLDAEVAELERQHADSAWVVSSVLDEKSEDSPARQHEKFLISTGRSRDEQTAALTAMTRTLEETAERRGRKLDARAADPVVSENADDVQELFAAATQRADEAFADLRRLLLPQLFIGWRSVWFVLFLAAGTFAAVLLLGNPQWFGLQGARFDGQWLGISAGIGLIFAMFVTLVVYTLAAMAQADVFRRWEQSVAEAKVAYERWGYLIAKEVAKREPKVRKLHAELEDRREGTLARYRDTYEARAAELRERRERLLAEVNDANRQRQTELAQVREAALAEARQQFDQRHDSNETLSHAEIDELKNRIAERMAARQREQSAIWSTLKTGWERATSDFWSAVDAARQNSETTFRPWSDLAAPDVIRSTEIPEGVRLGEYDVQLERWPGAVSSDMRLAPRKTEFRLPALLPFPGRPSLLLKTRNAESRAQALPILQDAMLRLLTLLPPGTVRFTLLDPVGLGDSFAGFMHLADADELLVTSRIWTEPSQIEARLADLTEHMENVLQTYLRNEFPTLEDYNRHAGEVAEPYRIVVIRDFPAKFSEIAARRLTSIITSGPRCGVYTLMSVDGKLQLPNNFHLADIESAMNVFEWREPTDRRETGMGWVESSSVSSEIADLAVDRPVDAAEQFPAAFYSTDPALSQWPLVPDAPPEPEIFSRIVKQAGAASRGARRVEVSFERIAPALAERWSLDSRKGIDVPMGRAGAVKLQHVRLGQGTSQHMLIAGKTGSGKSTFLHGLITNLALHYSPDELQFFLIDFKKGVEFKDYAAFRLPHARVIAIESDREFGVSALTRLDELMQERGELFRKHGVQDVAGFRNANPRIALPRILLVVDEFQEFFTEDDKYSQTAQLLLDRLVRQGRAFGIHVILGSQTLGGAYSLARSTLGQVAVRVALQCSEADAHLILSEENTAARLLTRPGEAIYNDANGLVEGNHPFQIAWLPDDKRETYLRDLQELTQRRGITPPATIVFEGNIPSDLERNDALRRLIEEEAPAARRITSPRIWLGDAVEIGDPTSIALERHSSSNLLIVGQDAEAVQGLFAAASLSLGLQNAVSTTAGDQDATDEPILWLFDGSPADDPIREVWSQLQDALGGRLRIVTPAEAASVVAQLEAERQRRDANRQEIAPTICVLVYNVSRFRDLRKAEDDFGFGSSDQSVSPAKQFAQLLSNGPDLGLHTVVWADSYNNVERWFSRQMLRDFELRVLFPMNAADSSNLIDSPLASRLGPGRAILYREDRGSTEKFRPYAVPSGDFRDHVSRRLQGESEMELATDLEGFSVT